MVCSEMIVVPLTSEDMQLAFRYAREQNTQAKTQGCRDRYGAKYRPMDLGEFVGKCGELGVAKHFQIPYNGSLNSFKGPDVGKLQVRTTTRRRKDANLIVRDRDHVNDAFILVWPPTKNDHSVILCGWEYGRGVRSRGRLMNPFGHYPMWVMDYDKVRPMESLPKELIQV